MRDLIFSANDSTFTRARFLPHAVLFEVVAIDTKRVLQQVPVYYDALLICANLATQEHPSDPVLSRLAAGEAVRITQGVPLREQDGVLRVEEDTTGAPVRTSHGSWYTGWRRRARRTLPQPEDLGAYLERLAQKEGR